MGLTPPFAPPPTPPVTAEYASTLQRAQGNVAPGPSTFKFARASDGKTRVDCREHCFACGILPKFKQMRMGTEPDAWECPEVKPYDRRGGKLVSVNDVIPLQVVSA